MSHRLSEYDSRPSNAPLTLADDQWPHTIDFSTLIQDSQARQRPIGDQPSEPHTPIEQIPIPGQPFYKRSEYSSVTSFATTDDEDGINEIRYPWTEVQDNLVKLIYQRIIDSPLTTPFSSRYPPSGVLHQVAKKTISAARRKNVYFPHSMDSIRRRLLLSMHQDENPIAEATIRTEFTEYMSQFTPKKEFNEDFDFSDEMATPKANVSDRYTVAHSGRPGLMPENICQLQSLAPPFQNSFERRPSEPIDPFNEEGISLAARRKRDSFRIKRGQF